MLTVHYALTRNELWLWYCAIVRKGFWVYLLGVPVLACGLFAITRIGGSIFAGIVWGLIYSAVLILFAVLWPQVRYRADERTLTFGDKGITAVRGKQAVQVPWAKIHSVTNEAVGIVIARRNYNALIIPHRAFGDTSASADAFRTISAFHQQSR
ncbi:YcxB family protein [Brevundimonas sp. Root1279]|uniref:YcxB family protein n=1 Tax=Brevundimonas sp. Root1279 TaxID=1736443 RepID=UPI0006F9DEDE|nr:YcxB family protein [Brevundimonas sp. Root1279]KQW83802.1 hypothetical protein ASC65_03940 [Brevundimonas sp. Root1279]